MRISVRTVALMALLIALSVVLTRFASIRIAIGAVEGIRIGFGSLPIILAAVLFGPVGGGIVGALADIVGFPFLAMGPYLPHFTLTSALTGVIPGLVLKFRRSLTVSDLLIAIGIGQLVSSVVLTPYFLNTLFGFPYYVIVPPRIVAQLIQVPVYAMFIRTLLVRLRSTVPVVAGRVGAHD